MRLFVVHTLDFFDGSIKKLGVENCYFPIFVSKAALEREKEHIADFAPEVSGQSAGGDSAMCDGVDLVPYVSIGEIVWSVCGDGVMVKCVMARSILLM